jgi:hypothetical protein
MTENVLRADPHRWGPGKVHLFDLSEQRTACGKTLRNYRGTQFRGDASEVTCAVCKRVMDAPTASAMLVLGIDIGSSGALALLRIEAGVGFELVDAFDMPCLDGGPAGRHSINAALMGQMLYKTGAQRTFVELCARPGDGAAGAFAFGRARGLIEGVFGL